MSINTIQLDSYTKDLAASATAENLVADSGAQWKFARSVIIRAVPGNTGNLTVGNVTRQATLLDGGEVLTLPVIINNAGASAKYALEEIFVKADTNGDDVIITLIEPSND